MNLTKTHSQLLYIHPNSVCMGYNHVSLCLLSPEIYTTDLSAYQRIFLFKNQDEVFVFCFSLIPDVLYRPKNKCKVLFDLFV